jgi:hypothetical protein
MVTKTNHVHIDRNIIMKVIVLRGFFVETDVKVNKGDVIDLPDDKAKYLFEFSAAREATKEDEENFLNSDRAVNFSDGKLNMGIRKFN